MNNKVKRVLLPIGGAVATGSLIAASLTTSAAANPHWKSHPVYGTKDASAVALYWLADQAANLRGATEYNYETKPVQKLVSTGGPATDGKPGVVPAIGDEKKSSAKSKNVNLPKTTGKVFFIGNDGYAHWCTASSIQSQYRNLVATAGHCVYDTAGNGDVLDKWVFVPGYYQGKAPWGIYVGKQAFTHYDFDVYEDYDKDYAFVTVYNGVRFDGVTEVDWNIYRKWKGDKFAKHGSWASASDFRAWAEANHVDLEDKGDGHGRHHDDEFGPYQLRGPKIDVAFDDSSRVRWYEKEVKEADYNAAPESERLASRSGTPEEITKEQFEDPEYAPLGSKYFDEAKGKYFVERYCVKQWYKQKVFKARFYVISVKDIGRLGDNVGGQGFAWNQKIGSPVFVFGYPAGEHPDGNSPYSGVTPKFCYGKTARAGGNAALKAEEQIAIRCAMTGGADGGPWLLKYSSTKRTGYINGVTSLFGDTDKNNRLDIVTSPYFDGETHGVYSAAANLWSGSIVSSAGELYH